MLFVMIPELTLADIVADCWRRLSDGASDPRAAFRFPVLATQGVAQAGPAIPAARIVVLRDANAARRELALYTDRRSMKIAEITAAPRVTLVFYDPADRIQLRVVANVRLHTDDARADAAWAACSSASRLVYRAQRGPGATIDSAFAWDEPGMLDHEGRENFAALVCSPLSLDWLELCEPTHRRAVFQWSGDRFIGRWIVP
jgi:pyridoxamine 5'-phosphate oxidase